MVGYGAINFVKHTELQFGLFSLETRRDIVKNSGKDGTYCFLFKKIKKLISLLNYTYIL